MQKWLKDNLNKLKDALLNTRRDLPWQVSTNNKFINLNEEFYEILLEKFIKADIGLELSEKIVSSLKNQVINQKITTEDLKINIKEAIKNVIARSHKVTTKQSHKSYNSREIASGTTCPRNDNLNLYLIVGINGSGKTTSIGKLAKRFKDEGFKVLIVAADTFRAAAGDQLSIWANKAGVEIYSPPEIKKPDAVIFSAIEKAKKENYNLLLIDTAGRLQTQTNLMDELKKINAVIEKQVKAIHELPQQYEKLIVLDATIGQNAITQAEIFSKAINLTGIILAKLDSSAKGGVVLNIVNKFSLPVYFIGTGEKIDDIAEFNLDEYLEGLLS